MIRKCLMLLLLLLIAIPVTAATYTVDDVPNVHRLDKNRYVSDPDNLLSDATRRLVDARLTALTDSTSAEVAYVIVESVGDTDIYDFAQQLATKWGIGKQDKNNGLLVLIVMDQHKVRIHTGYGMDGVIPDGLAGEIMDTDIVPYMRNGDLDGAVNASSLRISKILQGKENAAEIMSKMRNNEDRELEESLYAMLLIVAFCSLAFAIGIVINKLLKCRGRSNYERIGIFNHGIWLLILLTVTSLLMALPFLLLVIWLRRYYRHKPILCDKCGSKMHRLSEEEDNLYLDDRQNMEENLNSVDYDVWLCDKCGTTEIFPFVNKNSKYEVCPKCHTRSAIMVKDTVFIPPTTLHGGEGVRYYKCSFCDHGYDKHYKIPKREDGSAVAGGVVAGSILGGMGRGGGGGFSGGSFGGGGFGGGGASRGW